METELVGLKLRGQVSEEAFKRKGALLRAEKVHYTDEVARQNAHLATLEQSAVAIESLEVMRNRIARRLETATPQDKRWVLEALDTRVTVHRDRFEISVGVPPQILDATGVHSVHHSHM